MKLIYMIDFIYLHQNHYKEAKKIYIFIVPIEHKLYTYKYIILVK